MTCSNPTGNYVESITRNGETLGEFDNGDNSGWLYTLNGGYPSLGVSQQYLEDDDVIVFHYTDDYTVDWTTTEDQAVTAVIRLIDAIGTPVTLDSEAAIVAAREAYDKLTEAQKAAGPELRRPDCGGDGSGRAEEDGRGPGSSRPGKGPDRRHWHSYLGQRKGHRRGPGRLRCSDGSPEEAGEQLPKAGGRRECPGLFEDAPCRRGCRLQGHGRLPDCLGQGSIPPPLAPSAASGRCWAWPEAAERFPQATTTTWSLM